ncbi:MAG: efflux RND transporter periplasmic adaptor subunit [Kiritimatiellae bacterium]|nr:efflux RND transporter periplasmic adaptor subunit [Kiritimatiellia bacterium]
MFASVMLAAAVTLPVYTVKEVVDTGAKRYPGRICPVAEVIVRPQVTGEILEVGFANGQSVRKGDVLYRLDPVQYQATVKNAEAKVAELKANLEYAELTVTRHTTLVRTRAVSQDELDQSRTKRDAMRASLAAAEASLAAARDDLAHCTIVAPIDGKVGSTVRTAGNYVQKGDARLVTLVQTDPVRVRFNIACVDYAALFGADAARIAAEGHVSVQLVSGGDVCATGRIEYIENRADERTDSVEAYALLANPQGALLDGQTVMVTLVNRNGARHPAVPPNAIAQDMRGAYVWVVGPDGIAHERRIVRGAERDGLALVVDGLKAGERVVEDGVHRVREGGTITPETPGK